MKSKKKEVISLDYLLIPTGWEKQREKRVLKEISKRKIKNILILNGCNSEEDILYLGKKLKENEQLGFVTFPLHYQKYKNLIKKAQKKGKFPKKVKIEGVLTEQTPKQFIYGILSLIEERLNKEIKYFAEKGENNLVIKLKRFVKKTLH